MEKMNINRRKKYRKMEDRIRGMFMGVFMGDALGVPHEFRCNANVIYTGRLENEGFRNTQFGGTKRTAIGQISDDSEMTIIILRRIIADGRYIKDNVLKDYIKWANSGGWMMGNNTRALFKGIKTVNGYMNRYNKITQETSSQSNGALMRCAALSLLWNNDCIIEDVKMTNPNRVCIDCEIVYVNALRLALCGCDKDTIYNGVRQLISTEEVKEVFRQIDENEERDIKTQKGWCLHGLWCAFTAIKRYDSYTEAMRWIITQKGSDTDTNAAIAGGLLGALFGYERISIEDNMESNIEILLSVDINNSHTPRPMEYMPFDFDELTNYAALIFQKSTQNQISVHQ